jgi:transcriptional regulator with XRE-family HTH domain
VSQEEASVSRPAPAQERLASVLRGLREGAGLSTYELAGRMHWSQSKVTRIENGRTRATAEDAEQWADVTGAPEPVRQELSQLAYAAWTETRSWRASHRHGLVSRQQEMSGMDRAASEILHFQHSVIPGLLQAEGYARRVMTLGDVTNRGGIDAAVKARMKRQDILREPGRRFDYVLTEGALRWRPGSKQMMTEQLGKLLAAVALPNVTLSIIPFDREARTWYGEGFAIFRLPDGPVVLTEGYTKEDFLADPRDVEVYERVFALLRESALSGDAAADFARVVLLA